MSTSSTQLAQPTATLPSLQASAQQLAGSLQQSTGALGCYITLLDRPGQTARLLAATTASSKLPSWRLLDGPSLVRRALQSQSPITQPISEWLVLALPLNCANSHIGAVLLLYPKDAPIDMERMKATVNLAACALDATRQIAELQVQAGEIEERIRLREVQLSRNLLRGVIDSVPMGLALLDSEGVVLAANRALSERFGLEPMTLVGMAYGAVLGPWDEAPAARTFASGAVERMRRSMTTPDGMHALLEIASFPLLGPDGQPHQVVEVWEDSTERVALQTQLIRAEKLAAIGQLAASIAHEVGNPLQAIQGFLSLFLEQCPPETPNQRFLQLAEEEIERIVQVLARLRDLYRPRADVISWVDVNDLLDSVLLLTSKQLERARIQVKRELDLKLPQVRGVADQLKQVLLNLVLNAAEAMNNGGLLHVRSYTESDSTHLPSAIITITDSGVGIAPDQLPHIFDGLHTTKERGMGLGLYTSKAIIERHMGRISVQSTPGAGTTFTIRLPIMHEEKSV